MNITEKELDCCFTEGNKWFRYRAAAIIVENDCVLLAGNSDVDYYYSVGGGVHMGETAENAVLREVFEETGIHYEIDRLAVIHENFFNENIDALKGLDCHEISFYYLMKPRNSQMRLCRHCYRRVGNSERQFCKRVARTRCNHKQVAHFFRSYRFCLHNRVQNSFARYFFCPLYRFLRFSETS